MTTVVTVITPHTLTPYTPTIDTHAKTTEYML